MPDFSKGPGYRTPFGKNEYLRSTQDVKKESYTASAAVMSTTLYDGVAYKVLQPGVVMAKITSTAEAGKIGPFQADATDGRQTLTNIVGINATFLPWQLGERDVEVAVTYECTAVQAWCLEQTDATTSVALTDTTADAMRGTKNLDIMFA